MRVRVDPLFWQQSEQFQLRFCCEDCVYYDPQGQRCVHGWPNHEHQQAFYAEQTAPEVIFCKEFELR